MNFENIFEKIKRGWIIVLLTTVIGFLSSMLLFSSKTYVANISFTLPIDPIYVQITEEEQEKTTLRYEYITLLEGLSEYMRLKFTSPTNQLKIAEDLDIPTNNLEHDNPFFAARVQRMGFIELSYETNDLSDARIFLASSKEVYFDIAREWNYNRPEKAKVTPQEEFEVSIIEHEVPLQNKVLPPLAGFVLGLGLVIWMPNKKQGIKIKETK
jgi:hypothetical protein